MHRPTSPTRGHPRPRVPAIAIAIAIAIEAGLVLGIGLTAALLFNALSPRGIDLARNYFPTSTQAPIVPTVPPLPAAEPPTGPRAVDQRSRSVAATSPAPETSSSAEDLVRAAGFGVVNRAEIEALYRDPRHELELIAFVDARDDRHYQEGHIPRAFQLDRFYPDRYLPEVLAPCLGAEQVVVYCNGGDCEDSLFAARLLHEAGVPAESLSVYLGGIQEWQAAGLPLESGPRLSGDIRSSAP